MRKFLLVIILLSGGIAIAASRSFWLTSKDGHISIRVTQKDIIKKQQVETFTFISRVKLEDINGSCEVDLTFTPKQSQCNSFGGVNFCVYQIDGTSDNEEPFTINGMVGASYSIYQSYIELSGKIKKNNCLIDSFKSVSLYEDPPKSN